MKYIRLYITKSISSAITKKTLENENIHNIQKQITVNIVT